MSVRPDGGTGRLAPLPVGQCDAAMLGGGGAAKPRGRETRVMPPADVARANATDARRAAEPDPIPATIRFHDLWHTHASHMIAAGHSIKAVSRRLGHADITITLKVYAHLMPNDDEKLAAGVEALFGEIGRTGGGCEG